MNEMRFNLVHLKVAEHSFHIIAYSVLMVLVFYYKGMLDKATMQGTQQFSEFSLLLKGYPAKCSPGAVA